MSHVVTLRLSDEEYNKLKQAVQRTRLPQSEFIRNALANRVHTVMQVKSIKQESEVVQKMVSKNNVQVKDRYATKQVPHYGIRKLSVGVASVLLGTTFYMGVNGNVVHADTVDGQTGETPDSQVANSNSNVNSMTDSSADAVSGNQQSAGSVTEAAAKSEVNNKPQVTEITNDSHVQSDAVNTASNADAQSQSSQNRANAGLGDHQAAASNSAAAADSEINIKPQADAASNADAQNQSSQNHTNAGLSDKQPAASAAETAKLNVSDLKQADFGMAAALNTNLMESADDTVMEQAVQQTSTLRDDRSTDYAGYIKGQAQSVTLKDGSSLSVNSDVINSDTDKSAILTFKSSSFKPGDTYTILIPHIMMDSESDVAHLQPSFGTTTVDEIWSSNGKLCWKIVDRFVNSGTISQTIKLSRANASASVLSTLFSDSDFWRPYDLIRGTINLIKGTDRGSLDFKYQLGGVTKSFDYSYDLVNGDLNYPLLNGQAYDFKVYLGANSPLGDGLIDNGGNDSFGLSKDILKNVSFSIDNAYGYLKLNKPVANIYNSDHQLVGTMGVKNDHGKLIFSDFKLNDTIPVFRFLTESSLSITFNATVNVPKQLFNGQTFMFRSAVNDFSLTFNNPKVGSVKPGDPVANIKVLPDLNALSTGNLIDYQQNHHYMDLGAGDYEDDGARITKNTTKHSGIPGVYRSDGFNVSQMKLAVNGMTLSDLSYHLDIPDGFDLYTVGFNFLDYITSVIIRLKDGTSYKFSSDDLRAHTNWSHRNTFVQLNHGETSGSNDLKLDSNSSIASVDINYHDVDSSVDLGPGFIDIFESKYRIAPAYASGKPVQVGDLLKFTATLSSTDPRVKIDSAPLVLDDVLITDPNKDTLGVFHAIVPGQSSKTPGVVDAGTLIYNDCNSGYGFPHLKHAVAYLQIPDNASLTDIKKIVVKSGLNGYYGDLIPKSISLVKLANGVTFIKVDLSNYNDIRAGFSISVPYSNIGDLQTSSRPASMLVVSDNFDQNVSHVQHFSSDTDSRTDAAVKALINQENIDVNKTDYQGSTGTYSGWWDILASDGMTSATMTKGNVNSGPSFDSKQDDHAAQADSFNLYGTTINATDLSIPGAVQIINIPSTSDGHSQFNPQLTGPIHVIDSNTGKNLDDIAHVTYSESPAALHSDSLTNVANEIQLTADQVTDWSKIKSIVIRMNVPKRTSARAVLSMKDPQIYDHVGKTVYVANAIFSTQADSPASEYYLKPVVINAGDPASAKLAVTGQSTVKTVVHYKDAQGDHYVELPDKAQTYTELQDVMNRSDFLQSDSDLTAADRALLPAGMVLDYAHPTIKNSNETYLNNYQNGTAAFGQQVKYDFDQDQVIFEGAMPTQTSDTKTVTETIHYVYANGPKAGQKAVDDVTKSVEFNRTGFKNPFTGDVQWMRSTSSKTFDAVKSPEIKGYQADQSEIGTQTVTQDSDNIEKTVKYTAQQQKITVNYIDDDVAGKILHTDSLTGLSNETADYTTANEISTLTGQHYVLVSDDTKGQKPVYDDDADEDQVFNVHVKHATHSINDSRTVTETVHYQATDGSQVANDHLVKVNFSRTGIHDEVTGADHWNSWNISSYDFDAVPTPVKTGYTPDVQTVPAETVTPASDNIRKVVTYTPDAQKLSVKFIDDTTGQVLKTVTKTGVTNAAAGYNTQSDIQSYEGQHYVLVSDSSNGANLVFDNDDNTDQTYEVHLRHGAHQIDEHHTITQTVHYIATDHASVPDDHIVSVQFDRDGYHDEVTGVDHWNAWKQGSTQTFTEVPTPKKAGYTPDKSSVPATVVHPSDHNQTIDVTYTPDTQKVIITFIDDTDNGKTLKTVTKTGPTSSSAGYTTGNDISTYKGQHYVLVSDQTHGQSITFDADTNADQRYEVHLKHGTHPINDQRTITETVHYKMADGTTAPADHTAKAEFSRDGFNDEVTGDDHWNDWTPSATQQFNVVQSSVVKGYTPDTDQIPAVTVNPDSQNIERTVTYSPNVQIAHVKYIDDTDHKVLIQDDLTGRTGETSGYHTADRITEFKGQHYVLVSDNYPTDGMTFDNNDRVDQTYEVHFTHATRTDEQDVQVPRTIKYVYQNGRPAQPDHTDALSFHETKVVDLVDGHTVSDDWTSAQDFKAIETPAIQGYTPDHSSVSNTGIVHDHPVIVETVTYNPDAQKAVVKYIDDTTGEQLETKDLTGVSDQSTGYNTKETIDGYIARHYDLVSDGTNGETITFDHDDGADQSYEVHFKHATAPVTDHRAKDLTVHYVYADGQTRTGKASNDQTAPELTFNRTGVQDLVTNNISWNAWDHADQTFSAIDSPAIQGYTPDRTVVDNIKVNPDAHDSTEVTVTYHADAQKLTVNFIDDVTGQTLKTVAKTGYSDGNAGYNTKADIQNFVGQHYDLVSDATKGADLVFDHDDAADQEYDVHLTHHLTPISDHQVVNEIIHYVYADGLARTGKAADDYVAAPLEFNRTGKHDDVTGTDAWDAWIPGSASFATVQSPVIQGYTPDQSQIDAIPVDANSQDIVKTVTYSADQQKMTIDFIDDTDNGKVLKTVTKTGGSDEAVGYNTKADIQTFVDGHYKFDHDTSNGANLVFDHDDAVDQHYEVHLTHANVPITEETSTNQVIHYQLADGTPVAKDYTAKVDFSRDGFKDLVTNADHWNAWTPNATQTFDAVASPVKAGYTVDHAQVDAVTVEPHHADLETTVTYSPDAQKATVKYIDDVTGKTLQTKELTGVSDETSAYTTESTINQYVGQHYKLVSDQTNGKPVVFDHDDGSDQVFEVHLTHTYQNVSQEHQVHQTIHYQFADGKEARPDYTAAVLAFSRTGTQDLVTENIQWNAWTPDQTFAAVNTPAVNGYTPDVQTVAPVKVGHDSKDIEQTVVYHADDQTILVNYIDDDTHSTLKTDSIIGKTAQTSDYTTKKSLDQYKGQHYDVVSDDTNGDTLKFDTDSTKVQTYNVHLKHQHQAASDKSTVHQTVHYVYQDGKQAAKDHTSTPIEFTRTGDTDLVTGKTTWNAWTPATGTFVAVLSPAIAGYTPSRAMINHVDVHPGDKDLDTTVTYVPDQQVIVVNYIDQTTGKTLKTDTLNGRSDQTSSYATKSQIDSYLGQHYKLISDDTNGQTLTFDHDDQATQTYDVVLGHQTEAAHRTHEVHETVDYVYADGSQAAKSFTAQSIVFSQTGVHDLVTNTTDWNGEWTKPQVFVAVESPKIVGFTASKPEVKAVNVDHQSSDVHELVIYAANVQTAQIKYIDDVTGSTLETDGANGHFNEPIVFGHNVNDQINKFKQAHYKLVSNSFAGQKYQADNTKNVYEVHLIHERQNVHVTDSVTETVKFQYADGSQAQPVKTQTVNFGRDGIKDLVTGSIAWMPVDSQTIAAVDVPAIDGYTADTKSVPAVKVDFGDSDITKVVTYTANDQNAGIKIIDDTTGKVLNIQSAAGKFGTEIQFKQNPDQQVVDLQTQHYELVSDNFKHQKYQSDNAQNQFEIHVQHQMTDAHRTDDVTETVHYQDNHGNTLHPSTVQTKTFTEHGITDQVTGKTAWTPAASQTMDAVSAPEITGHTPDRDSVPAATVNFGDKDIDQTIVYTPVSETANIKYIDDTTGKTLLSDQTTGDFGSQIKFDHDPVAQIGQYEDQGYELVSNSYGETAHQFSATPVENSFEVHFKHGTMPVTDTDTVTETIHYLGPDGNKLAPDKTQTITFTRHGIKDQVTGQIDWNSVEPQEFSAVKSPVINGYQVDMAVVEGRQVLFGDQDVVVNVHYTKLPEQQPGKQPGTDMVNTGKVTPKKVVTVANGTVQDTKQGAMKNSAQSTMQDTKQLPQTGNDNRAGLLSLIGSSLMASLAIFGLNKKKKHEN